MGHRSRPRSRPLARPLANIAPGEALCFQTTHRHRDGSLAPVEISVHHVELADNEYACAVVQPLASRQPTETAPRESEERLALALAIAGHRNITDLKAAETKLRHHLDLEQAVAEISALMIKCDWEDFDACVNWTLERIGRLTQADRSYL